MNNMERKCWAAVNKDGYLMLFTEQPSRNENTGKWEGQYYLDSVVYKIVKDLIDKVNFCWENEPEYFEFGKQ